MKKIKVLAVCGFGVGTSLLLKMNIEAVLKKNNIQGAVENVDVTTAASINTDIIFTSKELYNQLKNNVKVPLVQIDNFMDKNEIETKGLPVINELIV
ncbi:PTS sugar transporter subunit IIB [Abyssisolibacter fermentans]|uniref:PTS sugar transporter subunit IIB n=1 Tax=Abyssisolibacter fermentans TaxID=1766203 RepID=UPI000AADD2D1|nr:PTS sugar transporter subunit IIB [Abyssisolibacter fermentans]